MTFNWVSQHMANWAEGKKVEKDEQTTDIMWCEAHLRD